MTVRAARSRLDPPALPLDRPGERPAGNDGERQVTDIKTTETNPNNNNSTPPTKGPGVKATQHANRKNRRAAAAKNKTARKAAAPKAAPKAAAPKVAPKAAPKKEAKPTDPKLVKVVLDHATKNKDRNGWGKVLTWAPDTLKTLLAGAKTENAAIKRTRAKIEEGSK